MYSRWTLTVEPSGNGDVTVTLPATSGACSESGAICTPGGTPLSGTATATVEGPSLPALSIADAAAQEGPNAFLRFEITLSEASDDPVTFAIATSDGTAIAGTDYVAKNRSKTIRAGRTTAWFKIHVIDDSHNEGDETFTVTISNVSGATIADDTAIGTIQNSDPIPQGWLARFGRTVAEQHVTVVRDRLGADRSPGFSGRFAGQPLPSPATGAEGPKDGHGLDALQESRSAPPASPDEEAVLAFRTADVPDLSEDELLAFRSLLADVDDAEDAGNGEETRTIAADDVLLGTSFAMARDSGTGFSTGFWGRAARSGFGGRDGETGVDGEVTSVMLGTDWKRKGTLFGLAVSESRGTGTYDGASAGGIDARLAALVPYAGREIGDGLSVWGAFGIGRGEMTLSPEGADPVTAGIGWSMAAAGAEGDLAPGERFGGADLGWHADALRTRTTSDAVRSETGNLAAASGETSRLRLGLKAAWERTLASGVTLWPNLEIGLRHDGGDAETGHGLEIGGGIGVGDPARGLSVSLEGRTLALHEDGAFDSWGLGVSVSWDPRPETRRGWSATAGGSLGGASSGGVDALLGPEVIPGLPDAGGDGNWSLEVARGAGRGHGMVGSTYGRVDGSDGPRLGYRIEPDADHAADVSLDLWADPGTDGDGHGGRRWPDMALVAGP